MFKELLRSIMDRVEGAIGVSLVALDGIAIDSINTDGDLDLEIIAAEFGSFLKTMQVSNSELRTGEVEQFTVVTDRFIVIMSGVTSEYYLLVVLSREGNYSRARWECRRAQDSLRAALA